MPLKNNQEWNFYCFQPFESRKNIKIFFLKILLNNSPSGETERPATQGGSDHHAKHSRKRVRLCATSEAELHQLPAQRGWVRGGEDQGERTPEDDSGPLSQL